MEIEALCGQGISLNLGDLNAGFDMNFVRTDESVISSSTWSLA
jgi:hypothetical protein